jgi:serine/threonine kinase 32
MKKANFDVSHELDEFMMVEKPLTHSKRKANPDLEKMKPELRQMEEQYVLVFPAFPLFVLTIVTRFTVYDFTKNSRISYYPHNQPIVTTINQDEDDPATVLQSVTNTLLPTSTLVDRNSAGSPPPDLDGSGVQPMVISRHSASPDLPSRSSHSVDPQARRSS